MNKALFKLTAARKGADVVLIWHDAYDKSAITDRVRQKPDYNKSSGNSFWVRQYLKSCETASAVPPQKFGRLNSGVVRGVHAT